jgi:hypothetical protein
MTYTVGINRFGTSAILCDTYLTGNSLDISQNVVIKSGKFWDGCIYGCAGDLQEIAKFVYHVRESMIKKGTLADAWDNFLYLVHKYPFPPRERHFELILASRHSGESRLYLLDSCKGLVKKAGSSPDRVGDF